MKKYEILGFSLVEVMIAVSITALVVGAVMEFFIIVLKMNKSVTTQLNCAAYAKKFIEKLSAEVRHGIYVKIPEDDNGNTLLVFNSVPVGVMSGFYFRDADGNLNTINDNSIWYDEDINDDTNDVKLLAKYVTPVSNNPIFQGINGSSPTDIYYDPVLVKLRIGDPGSNSSAGFNKDTGRGIQGINVDTMISLRNTALPTATP
jgi:type II secretory pathway pseudopilin PulG